jgi:hypothetical protein
MLELFIRAALQVDVADQMPELMQRELEAELAGNEFGNLG